jgi:hypothetical protein
MICYLLWYFSLNRMDGVIRDGWMDGMKERNKASRFTGKFISQPA